MEDIELGVDGRFRERFFHDVNLSIGQEVGVISFQKGQVIKPSIQLKDLDQEGNKAQLDISLQDDNLTYLAVFVNDVKTQLKIFPGNEVEKALSLPITLEEGLNEIRLIATDKDDVTSVLPLRCGESMHKVSMTRV